MSSDGICHSSALMGTGGYVSHLKALGTQALFTRTCPNTDDSVFVGYSKLAG
jgi:hypothetical protein